MRCNYGNCLDLFHATQEMTFNLELPATICQDSFPYKILGVKPPYCFERVDDSCVKISGDSCCFAEVVLKVDTTECEIKEFQTFISNNLSAMTSDVVSVTDGMVSGWAEECDIHTEYINKLCASCSKICSHMTLGEHEIKASGATTLSDGWYEIHYVRPVDLKGPRYSSILSLLTGRWKQQHIEGNVTSHSVSHGTEKMSTSRKLRDYSTEIENEIARLRGRWPISVVSGSRQSCKCRRRGYGRVSLGRPLATGYNAGAWV